MIGYFFTDKFSFGFSFTLFWINELLSQGSYNVFIPKNFFITLLLKVRKQYLSDTAFFYFYH